MAGRGQIVRRQTSGGRYNGGMDNTPTRALLRWYRKNSRQLPWRRTQDPYAVWVSEVMLQQTRVDTVIPFFRKWMRRFPTVAALARARRNDVLKQWEGMGYYRRAVNLHRASLKLMQDHGGQLPVDAHELLKLPGIGKYTASAIAAIAFGGDSLALDGNLRRVLSRLFDAPFDVSSAEGERRIRRRAAPLLPHGKASEFNQAMMDLGATICKPRRPDCDRCPIRAWCRAYRRGVQEMRPVRRTRAPLPERLVTAAVLRDAGRVLIGRRHEGKLLGGLWEFPGGKRERRESLKACLRRELKEELGIEVGVGDRLGVYDHTYSHFRVRVHAFECHLIEGKPKALDHAEIRWVLLAHLDRFPMGKVDRAIARALQRAARESGGSAGNRPAQSMNRAAAGGKSLPT
jgi:A/G-specific adenine glycosylase